MTPESGAQSPPSPDRPRRRDYEKVLASLEQRWKRRSPERSRKMADIVEALWEAFGGRAYSWVGFYLPSADGKELALGPRRDRPACSPIGAHGVCGRAAAARQSQVVADVRTLGDACVECDPEDRSEIAVPVIDDDGKVFAVLDADSKKINAFDDEDRRWLERIVKSLGRTPPPHRP